MARRKQSLFEDVITLTGKLPWWAGVVFAVAAYVWLHGAASNEASMMAQPGRMGEFVGQTLFKTLASVGQYLLPFAFLLGAAISAYAGYRRRTLHEQVAASPDRAVLDDMSWVEFEALVGEAFRRKAYAVDETGGGGADGGVDLVLKKEGETFLVQCKQWKATKVSVSVVRELYGVMAARGAAGAFVVTSGVFTDKARAFAYGQNIELIDGEALHALISGVSVPAGAVRNPLSFMTTGAPFCPVCQSRMEKRVAKNGPNAGNEFWGCIRFPDCRGTRPV